MARLWQNFIIYYTNSYLIFLNFIMNNSKEIVKDFIVDNFLFGNANKLDTDTPLFEKGIIDSTGVLELLAFIEENFNIKVSDEELVLSNFSSINAIEKFVLSKNNHTPA